MGLATLDRPARRNALSVEMCDQLRAHLAGHRGLRAVVLTGAGSAFCAGADLGDRLHGGGDSFRPAFEAMLDEIVGHPAPVIAAVNGPALGGGTQLVVACDLRVAAPGATFGIPAAQLGVMLSPENIQRLALLVGQGHARDLLLTGRRIEADEAFRMGLVQRVAADALAGGLALAEEIATLAPLSVAGHKAALNAVARHMGYVRGEDDAVIAPLDDLVVRAFASDDLQEGLAAFSEKRPPDFAGR